MILTIIVLSVLVTHASLAPLCNKIAVSRNSNMSAPFNNADPAIQLYNSVIIGDYRRAVETTLNLEYDCEGDVISSVVNRLLLEGKTNIVEYAYSLWYRFGENIVKVYFPIEFRLLFSETPVMLINKRDGLPLKLELETDNIGDRAAYGAGSVNVKHPVPRVSLKIFPVWDKNKVYFKIFFSYHTQYLKLEVKTDHVGEHKAFGSKEDDTWRQEWYFHPIVYDKQILFYIYNKYYQQALKLARAVEDYGDRQLWGHNGDVVDNPEHFGWHIAPF